MTSLTPEQLADFAALVAAAMQAQRQAAPTKPVGLKDLGIAQPTPFTGGKDYLRFRRECLAYIAADDTGLIFTSGKKKISFILSYMKEGTASTWAQNYYDAITSAAGVVNITDTFDAFLKKLDLSFKDPGEKDRAYKRWSEMRQGNADAGAFLASFEIAMHQAGISTTDVNVVLPQLKVALREEVAAGLIRLPTKPTMYDDMKSYIISIDAAEREVRLLKKQNTPQPFRRPVMTLQPAPQRPALFDPSRGDKKDTTGVTFGGQGEPMQVTLQRLRSEGRCFECGQTGHIARHCRKKKTTQVARAVLAELSDELKELLRNELFAEADLASTSKTEEVLEENNAEDEDFQTGQ